MRFRSISIALLLLGACIFAACSGGDGVSGSSSSNSFRVNAVATGPCSGIEPLAWADSVVADNRGNIGCTEEFADSANILGEADGVFVSIGADSGNSIVVEMGTPVVNGPDCDLVIYEVDTGEDIDQYDVYLSDAAADGFVFVARSTTEGTFCIDLDDTGVSGGRYVKIVQIVSDENFKCFDDPDTCTVCDSTWGADIDAIGVLNDDICPDNVDYACDYVGRKVDGICPPDGDYPNHGAYASSVAHATTDVIRTMGWDECFSDEQLDAVHGCVVSQRARTDIGKKR